MQLFFLLPQRCSIKRRHFLFTKKDAFHDRFAPVIYLLVLDPAAFFTSRHIDDCRVCFFFRFFHEQITNITKQKSETKSWNFGWFLFFVSDKSLIHFFQESSANCCLSGLEYKPPQVLIPFIERGSTAPCAKKVANLGLKAVEGSIFLLQPCLVK